LPVTDLLKILAPHVARARELLTRITKPAESIALAGDFVDDVARPNLAADARNDQFAAVSEIAVEAVSSERLPKLVNFRSVARVLD
jgi:hypothetical protein